LAILVASQALVTDSKYPACRRRENDYELIAQRSVAHDDGHGLEPGFHHGEKPPAPTMAGQCNSVMADRMQDDGESIWSPGIAEAR
jgi:hypothetical protein